MVIPIFYCLYRVPISSSSGLFLLCNLFSQWKHLLGVKLLSSFFLSAGLDHVSHDRRISTSPTPALLNNQSRRNQTCTCIMNEATRTRYQIKRKARSERYVSFKLGSTKDGRDTTNIFDHKIYIVKEIRLHAYIHQYHIALDYIKVRDHCHRTKQRKM